MSLTKESGIPDVQTSTGWRSPKESVRVTAGELKLPSDVIHVWWASLDLAPPGYSVFKELLSKDESRRCEQFRYERDRLRYCAGRSLLRMLLSRYVRIPASELSFLQGPYGKPMLAGDILFFNMSKSAGRVVFAVSKNRRVGVDIEQICDHADPDGIARRYFSIPEHSLLSSCSVERKSKLFLKCWTRKEAVVKAVGLGLSMPLDSFDVSRNLDGGTCSVRLETSVGALSQWSVYDLAHMPGFAAAVAVEGSCCSIRQADVVAELGEMEDRFLRASANQRPANDNSDIKPLTPERRYASEARQLL